VGTLTVLFVAGGMVIFPAVGTILGLAGIFASIFFKEGFLFFCCSCAFVLAILFLAHLGKKPPGYYEDGP